MLPDVLSPQQAEAAPGHQAVGLLAGVLAAAKAALPRGLDLLVWGAARLGDQATLRHLLANGGGCSWAPSDDNMKDREGGGSSWAPSDDHKEDDEGYCGGDSCLWVASRFGHEGAVKVLLESGVDVDEVRTDRGTTPLSAAAYKGHHGVVKQLLKAGADVNKARTDDGFAPLIAAAQEGHEGVVEQLLKAGVDPNIETTRGGETPLTAAADNGHSRVCSLLLEAGANVNHWSHADQGAALRIAVAHGHREATLVLVEHGASPSNETLTPPMLKNLKKWMAEALVEYKRVAAEINRKMEEIVQGIPELCAQAASVAAEGKNDGSSSNAPAPPQPSSCAGRKRKAPSAAE